MRTSLLLSFLASLGPSVAVAAERPNIILYMVDDLGWNHIGVPSATLGTHPPRYHTPHLAQLAKEGLSLPYAYAQPNCAPTRAAMLSGQYPARIHNHVYVVGNLSRFGKNPKGRGVSKENARFTPPPQTEDVAVEAITIGEALQKNGYTTAHIGKFHVGGHEGGNATLPENAGFDINIGGFKQGHQPTCFGEKTEDGWAFPKLGRGDFDRWAAPYDEAYVKAHDLPEALVGQPKHISDAVGDAMVETIGKLAADDKPFYLQFFTYAVHTPVKSRPDLEAAARERDPKGASYSGFVSSVDENLRRMRLALSDPNADGDPSDSIADNTLILFTSDNGGINASNDPLLGHKGMFSEGGIRVPLIACWPGVIPPGTVSNRKVHCLDYYPTALDLAKATWRPDPKEHPLDGDSFASALRDPSKAGARSPIFYFFPGYLDNRAAPMASIIHDVDGGRYKLRYEYEPDAWELYDLLEDPGESTNIAKEQPEVVSQLATLLREWMLQEQPTWQPQYPIDKETGKPTGPPPVP